MADPLSIAASIAGVITLADVVFLRTKKYLQSARNADKEVHELSMEVLLLGGALHSLSRLAQALDTDGLKDQHVDNLRMYHIAACHATLDEIAKKLKKLEDSSTKRKLVWPFASDRTKTLLNEVSRHKENVNLALTADSMGKLLQILSKTETVIENTEQILEEAKKTREIVNRIHQDSARKKILDYFLTYNPQQNYEMSLSLRYPRTGLWLTRKPEFQTWLASPDSALWLSGIPGAGKTVLAGTIIEEALKKTSEDVATAFYFCDYKNITTQTTENILSALASQLAIQKEVAYDQLERYYRVLHPDRALERRPDISGLQRILNDMVKSFDHIYLIIDGLDECGDNTNNVVDSILDIIGYSDNISTALLSRDEHNIRDRLEEDFTGVEIAAHTEDITEYVTSEIEKRISNKSLRIDDLSLKGEILERLIDGAKGMFRWVACQLDSLGDCISDKECREALDQLPPGLNDSYLRILQRVPKGKQRLTQMMLNFIAYAKPRLGTALLREALSVPETVSRHDNLDSLSIVREDSITRLCRSLVRKSNDGRYYEFAHFSVLEYLEGEMESVPEMDVFRVSKSTCESLLAKQCLKFLLYRDFSSLAKEEDELLDQIEARDKQHPFYAYAAYNWPIFARHHWMDQSLVKTAEPLFQPTKSENFTSWALKLTSSISHRVDRISILGQDDPSSSDDVWDLGRFEFPGPLRNESILRLHSQLVDGNFTALHLAAALSLPVICSCLVENGMSLNQRSCFGTPLQCALQGLLLVIHEDDVLKYEYLHPYVYEYRCYGLTNSSQFGRENTVRSLLKAGATQLDACSSPFAGQTLITVALRVADYVDDLGAAVALLEAGVDVEEEDLSQLADLREVILDDNDHEGTDRYDSRLETLIICLGPMIDQSIGHFRLCQAAWSLAIELGCEFAKNSFVVDTRISMSQDSLSRTIFTSIRDANIGILTEVLKDPRADIEGLNDSKNKSAFDHALELLKLRFPDGLAVVKVLLSSGMNVHRSNHEGLLPIHDLAKCNPTEPDICYDALCEIVGEFVRKGTGCNVRSQAKDNILHLGLHFPNFIRAVLEVETEGNIVQALRTRDEGGYTPISLALREGWEEAALLLLRTGKCDPESLGCPTSVRALCVSRGTQRAFNMLLDAGIGSGTNDASNASLLHHAGPKTSKEFVLQLIRMFPSGLRSSIDGKLPLDTYLESCINFESPELDPDVVHLLTVFGSDELNQREKKGVWENFTRCVSIMRHADVEKSRTLRGTLGELRGEIASRAISCLSHLGFIQSYEAAAHVPGILSLLKPLRDDLDNLWPISSDTLLEILEQMNSWESVRESAAILGLLKAAVNDHHVKLAELLLENGVSMHQRINKTSALEVACFKPAESFDAKHIFKLLLQYANESLLDEINPYQGGGKGLIHYLSDSEKQWQLEELLKRGVDVDVCTSIGVGAQSAVVLHLSEGSTETAMTLLKIGADPTITDNDGIDAALEAAFQGNVAFLHHLHTAKGQDWQLNWRRTCSPVLITINGADFSVSEINALHLAAWNGHCDVLRFYVNKGLLVDLDSVSAELLTPMHLAAVNGEADAIKCLHSRGASLNLKDAGGCLPLHFAVQNDHIEVVKFLVEHGSVMDNDVYGMSPVDYAIDLQREPILDCLRTTQQYLAYRSEPRQYARDSARSYEQALIRGNIEQCETLRSQGCPINVDLPRQNGRSALLLAIEDSNEKLIKWLLAHNAKATGKVSIANRGCISPLQAMIMRSSLNNSLPLLLHRYQSEGASVTAHVPSLICIAIANKNNRGLELLLDHIAKFETTKPSESIEDSYFDRSAVNQHRLGGGAPLHFAARDGNCEAVKLLLDHGADIDILDHQQLTPLQIAIASEPSNNSPMSMLLVRHGAALEHRDYRGRTAVMYASEKGKLDLIRLMADAGADLKVVDYRSWSALQLAASLGHKETFAWLLSRGLDVHAKNSIGWSAARYAMFCVYSTSYILNFGSVIDDIEPVTYGFAPDNTAYVPRWLRQHFNMYLRRLGLQRVRVLANLEPQDSWSPLCMAAVAGQTLVVTNLLRLGADVDYEGCPSGSALMAACYSGRVESVKMLIRNGAAISYLGANGFRSAVDCAKKYKAIVDWLMVKRFTEQKKLSSQAKAGPSAHPVGEVQPWSGITKAELVITGDVERQVHESARNYFIRLMAVKRWWRGKVVPQHTMAETHRPSRLIPEETVRICPGDYGVSNEQK